MNCAVLAAVISGIWTRVMLTIRKKKHILWRAVDQDGNVLDMRVAKPTQYKGSHAIFPQATRKAARRPTSDSYRLELLRI
jgi:DDE domain